MAEDIGFEELQAMGMGAIPQSVYDSMTDEDKAAYDNAILEAGEPDA
jgi:hypothetical protein